MNPTIQVKDFIDPQLKDEQWAYDAMHSYYNFGQASCLLPADWETIKRYAEGDQPMAEFENLFKRVREESLNHESNPIGHQPADMTGVDFEALGVLAQPLQSAINLIKKQPIYVKSTAIDKLAFEKKKADFDFLKHRGILEKDLAEIGAAIKTKIEVPRPENNTENVDISNFGLDANKDDELNLFIQLFHKLPPESAMEVILYALAYLRDLKQTRDLQAQDQIYYGVSAQMTDYSMISGIPDASYIHPGEVYAPQSNMPDYSDNPFRYRKFTGNYEEFANKFGDELLGDLEKIFSDYYLNEKNDRDFSVEDLRLNPYNYTVPVIYMEFKSWDIIRFHKKKTQSGMINEIVDHNFELRYSKGHPTKSLRGVKKKASDEEYVNTRYVQQTYTGYFFPYCENKRVYRYQKLNKAFRKPGQEAMSCFSLELFRSAAKSPAKLCIPIVKDIQRAYLKLQQCIINAKPPGSYIDMKFIRNASMNLSSTDFKMTVKEILNMYVDKNTLIGDSEGYEGDYNTAKPHQPIPGGVGKEVEGLLLVINDGVNKIGKITGTDGITGQSANPDSLVGLQKLMLQSSVNSLFHVQEAVRVQTERTFRGWSSTVQMLLKNRNSEPARTIEAIVGAYKADALQYLHTVPSHTFSIMVEAAPTEQEQNDLNQILLQMFNTRTISGADYFNIKRIFNTKDAQLLLGIRERKQKDEATQARAQDASVQLQQSQIRSDTDMNKTKYVADSGVMEEKIKAQSAQQVKDMDARMKQMEINLTNQFKLMLQQDRTEGQKEKQEHKAHLDAQKPLLGS